MPRSSEKIRASFLPFYMGTHYCTVIVKDRDQVRVTAAVKVQYLFLHF
jgi:hypothetical protein